MGQEDAAKTEDDEEEEFEDDFEEEDESPPQSPEGKKPTVKVQASGDDDEEFEDDFEDDDGDEDQGSASSPAAKQLKASFGATESPISPGEALAESPSASLSLPSPTEAKAAASDSGAKTHSSIAAASAAPTPSSLKTPPSEKQSPSIARELSFAEPDADEDEPLPLRKSAKSPKSPNARKATGFVKLSDIKQDDEGEQPKVNFAEPDADDEEAETPKMFRKSSSRDRKPTGFVKLSDIPKEEEEDEDDDGESKVKFKDPEPDSDDEEADKPKMLRKSSSRDRKSTGFVKLSDIAKEEEEDEDDDGESKVKFKDPEPDDDDEESPLRLRQSPSRNRKATGFVKPSDLPKELLDEEDDEDDDDEKPKVKFAEPEADEGEAENPQMMRQSNSPKRKATGFLKPSDIPKVDEDDDDDESGGSKVKFKDLEPQKDDDDDDDGEGPMMIRQSPSRNRKQTGFLKPSDLPKELLDDDEDDEDDAPKVKFADDDDDDEDEEEKLRRRPLRRTSRDIRKATGFLKPSDLPQHLLDEDDDDDDEPKVKFADPESDDDEDEAEVPLPTPSRSPKRKGTGFVKLSQIPVPPDDEEDSGPKVKFADANEDVKENEEAEEPVTIQVAKRSPKRKGTGFVKKADLPKIEDMSRQISWEDEAQDEDQKEPSFQIGKEEQEMQKRAPSPSSSSTKPVGVSFTKPSELDAVENRADEVDADERPSSGGAFRLNQQRPHTPLNEGEEGEEDDPDDDDDVPAGGSLPPLQSSASAVRLGRGLDLGPIQRSSSAPTLAGAIGVARRKYKSHLAPKPKVRPRKVAPPTYEWDERHHLAGSENENLPKKLRVFFSRPQSEVELREELERRSNMASAVKRLDQPEARPLKTPISGDVGPPVIPHKHEPGGHMKDREGEVRPWNNRWSEGIGTLNDGMHPLHREYFCKPSLFAEAPSQRWRRYADTEVEKGVWKPNLENRPRRFPPIGCA